VPYLDPFAAGRAGVFRRFRDGPALYRAAACRERFQLSAASSAANHPAGACATSFSSLSNCWLRRPSDPFEVEEPSETSPKPLAPDRQEALLVVPKSPRPATARPLRLAIGPHASSRHSQSAALLTRSAHQLPLRPAPQPIRLGEERTARSAMPRPPKSIPRAARSRNATASPLVFFSSSFSSFRNGIGRAVEGDGGPSIRRIP